MNHSIRLVAGLMIVTSAAYLGCGADDQTPVKTVTTDPQAIEEASKKDWSDHTQGLEFVIGFQNGLDRAKQENRPAMMFATTTWCGWCKRLAQESFHDAEVKELLSNFVLTIVDGDIEQEALVSLGATGGFPHIVFLSSDGRKLGEQMGYVPAAEFKTVVAKALKKASP